MKAMKILVFFLLCCLSSKSILSSPGSYEAIFNFGDSLSDTGNFLLSGALAFPEIKNLPYGETFFHHATGRCSNGRLIIDFIAEAFGLPYLPPYLAIAKGPPVRTGVNFAVAGATAIDSSFFNAQNIVLWTNDSLSVQLGWFNNLKSSLCATKQECDEYFKKSLFLVGEVGGNDYIYPSLSGQKSLEQLRAWVPQVVGAITRAIRMLIEEGAVDLVVPGQFPIGCSAIFLTFFQSPDESAYDPTTGCLKAYNAFFEYHDNYLKQELENLREEYPHARIMYADYYGASVPIYRTPKKYGFYGGALSACCGGGGPYNYNISVGCGDPGSTVCNPSTFVDWDGIHLTESAYHHVAKELIYGGFTSPPLLS